jgi:hypothetical protein
VIDTKVSQVVEEAILELLSRPPVDICGYTTDGIVEVVQKYHQATWSRIVNVLEQMKTDGKLVSWASRSSDTKTVRRVWGIADVDRTALGTHR